MFRHPDSLQGRAERQGQRPGLRRKDRFPRLPLAITLRETLFAMALHWRELLALVWLPLLVYVGLSFALTVLLQWFGVQARESLATYLIRAELLALVRAGLLEFLLVGFYALSVYRLMLLGEPLNAPKFSDAWLRRYVAFISATARAMALPLLAFLPYVLYMTLQIVWASQGRAPSFVPLVLLADDWPGQVLRAASALVFYVLFARTVFVQAATAVDVPYSPRESWRVTAWIWGHMLVITALTLGVPLLPIMGFKPWSWR